MDVGLCKLTSIE